MWYLVCVLWRHPVRDDEAEVRRAVSECAAAIGRVVCDISSVTDVLLPVLRGEVSSKFGKRHWLCCLVELDVDVGGVGGGDGVGGKEIGYLFMYHDLYDLCAKCLVPRTWHHSRSYRSYHTYRGLGPQHKYRF